MSRAALRRAAAPAPAAPRGAARSAVLAFLLPAALAVALPGVAGAGQAAQAGATAARPATSTDDRDAAIEQRWRAERAACLQQPEGDTRQACLKGAAAARAEARAGRLGNGSSSAEHQRHAVQRCQALPPADKAACEQRMAGAGTTSGSVAAGGMVRELRETVVGVPGDTAASASAPAAAPAASPATAATAASAPR